MDAGATPRIEVAGRPGGAAGAIAWPSTVRGARSCRAIHNVTDDRTRNLPCDRMDNGKDLLMSQTGWIHLLIGCGLVVTAAGCDALRAFIDFLPTQETRVELVNNGDFPVEVELYYDEEQDIPESLLTTDAGTRLTYTIEPGQSTTFSRNCDELQAIVISDADLQIIGSVGPEATSDVLRDGDDFGCGDTIVFTFDHSDVLVDFDVTPSVEGGS